MTAKTRHPVMSVPEAELAEWYAVGWTYVGADEASPDHAVIKWEHDKTVVAPFSEAMRLEEAVGFFDHTATPVIDKGRAEG